MSKLYQFIFFCILLIQGSIVQGKYFRRQGKGMSAAPLPAAAASPAPAAPLTVAEPIAPVAVAEPIAPVAVAEPIASVKVAEPIVVAKQLRAQKALKLAKGQSSA